MKIGIFLLLLTIVVSSCAPMPGNTLISGVTAPSAFEEVDVRLHKANIISTSAKCWSLLAEYDQYGIIAMSLVLNLGIIPACAHPWVSNETGKIVECDIYYSADMLLEHELRHCKGYTDLLY